MSFSSDPSGSPKNPEPAPPVPVQPEPATPVLSVPSVPDSAPPTPQPVWAKPQWQTAAEWSETAPLEYHQLLRGTPKPRWWKPLVGLALGVIYYFTFSVVYSLIIGGIGTVFFGVSLASEDFLLLFTPDTQRPLSLVMALGSIALMIPATVLAMMSVGISPAGRLWSVALRIRWRLIGRTVLPAIVALFLINAMGVFLDIIVNGVTGGSGEAGGSDIGLSDLALDGMPAGFDARAALWSVLFILLLVPLQASAEELVFRGAFMQAIGVWHKSTWFIVLLSAGIPAGALLLFWLSGTAGLTEQGGRVLIVGAVVFTAAALMRRFTGSPFIAIALPSLIFALAHIYEIWGMLSVASMALIAAWLAWRTGGLEAAITLHVVNNIVGMMFMVFAVGGETGQTAEGGTPIGLIATVAGQLLFAWWVDRDFRKYDGRRTRVDRVFVPTKVVQNLLAEGPVQHVQIEHPTSLDTRADSTFAAPAVPAVPAVPAAPLKPRDPGTSE